MSLPRWLRWPPERTGLEAPYLEALLSRRPMPPLAGTAFGSLGVGIAPAGLVLAMDRVFFAGESLLRIRSIGALPLWMRSIVPIYAAVIEEVVYRLGLMTIVVWLATAIARRDAERPAVAAAWVGILVSAALFALAHVGNAPNAAHPVLRALALNGLSGIVLGWLYWKRGFEAAVLAHFGADVFIYVVMAGIL